MNSKEIKLQELDDSQVSSVAGGVLTDGQVDKFFPDSKNKSFLKNNHTVATCEKCGKEFPRCTAAIGMKTDGPQWRKYLIKQRCCKECADKEISNDSLCNLKS